MSLRIAFVRPRLGMGGAERLVIDAARALGARGHRVALFAPDRAHVPQFDDVRSPHFSWTMSGGWLPDSVFGRLRAPAAIVRSGAAGLWARRFKPDIVVADVTSHVIPWLRRVTRAPVVFYCHFPDALLTRDGARDAAAYRSYRGPLDGLEARGLDAAQALLANSAFTRARMREVFPNLHAEVLVVAPGLDVSQFTVQPMDTTGEIGIVVVSRFDPRKNLALAIESFAAARRLVAPEFASRMVLNLAGRYDARRLESRELLAWLRAHAVQLGLGDSVRFHLSPNDASIRALIARSRVVLYPPSGEHFGYGPLEAMASQRPVIAVNNGGPAETIMDGVTGFLCPADTELFARALAECVVNLDLAVRLGLAGREHVTRNFSLASFGVALEGKLLEAMG